MMQTRIVLHDQVPEHWENQMAMKYQKGTVHQIERYGIKKFGDVWMSRFDSFSIQIWLNEMAEQYSESVVRSCHSNIRAITAMARKQKFLQEHPGEDGILWGWTS